MNSDSLDHRPTFSLPLLPVSVALLLFAGRSLMWWSFCLVLYFFFRKKFFDVHLGAFGFAIFVDRLVLLHGPFSHAILLLGCLMDFLVAGRRFPMAQYVVNVHRRRCMPSLWSILSRSWRYSVGHKKKLEKLPFIPFLSSALLIVLHFRY